MAILITGKTGFVGKHLVDFFQRKNLPFFVFSGNILEFDNFHNFENQNINLVIHLAAAVSGSPKQIIQTNVQGTNNVIRFCQNQKAKLIFLSSAKTISQSRDPYTESKRQAEKNIKESGIEYFILRPSVLYGSGDKKNIGLLWRITEFLPVVPVVNFIWQPLWIEDLIKIIYLTVKNSSNRKELTVCGPEKISFFDILLEFKKNNGKFLILNFPRFFGAILKVISYFPFLPISGWQIRSLMDNETIEGDDWQYFFGTKAIHFSEGIKKIISKNFFFL